MQKNVLSLESVKTLVTNLVIGFHGSHTFNDYAIEQSHYTYLEYLQFRNIP